MHALSQISVGLDRTLLARAGLRCPFCCICDTELCKQISVCTLPLMMSKQILRDQSEETHSVHRTCIQGGISPALIVRMLRVRARQYAPVFLAQCKGHSSFSTAAAAASLTCGNRCVTQPAGGCFGRQQLLGNSDERVAPNWLLPLHRAAAGSSLSLLVNHLWLISPCISVVSSQGITD